MIVFKLALQAPQVEVELIGLLLLSLLLVDWFALIVLALIILAQACTLLCVVCDSSVEGRMQF